MQLTWLDSNSWLIELEKTTILLDPWLVDDLFPQNLSWLVQVRHHHPPSIPDHIDLILLSQGLPDHTHQPTLKQLDHQIPVVGSPNAAKIATDLGYAQVTSLAHGQSFTFAESVEIIAIPGSPVGPTTVENGYLIRDLSTNQTIYYEPHGYHTPSIQEYAPIDVVIAPIINLKIPLVGAVIKGQDSALQACQWLQPKVILPTAAGGDISFEGLLTSILKAEGTVEDLRLKLASQGLNTEVIEPKSREPIKLL